VAQAVFILFLIILSVLKLQERSKIELFTLYSSLAGAICSLIVIILSPGNANRQAQLPPTPGFIKLVSISVQGYLTFIQGLLIASAKLSGLLGAILVAMWIGRHYRENFPPTKPALILAYVIGAVILSFVCFPPGVYGYSAPPPTRIMIIPVFFLIFCILCASFLTGSWLDSKYDSLTVSSDAIILAATILIGFSTLTTTSNLLKDRDMYVGFAKKWDEVDVMIKQAKQNGDTSIEIPAMDNWAHLDRPNDEPTFWATQCYTDFYGIQIYGPSY